MALKDWTRKKRKNILGKLGWYYEHKNQATEIVVAENTGYLPYKKWCVVHTAFAGVDGYEKSSIAYNSDKKSDAIKFAKSYMRTH